MLQEEIMNKTETKKADALEGVKSYICWWVRRLNIQSCDSGESALSLAGLDWGFCRPVTMDTHLKNCGFCISEASLAIGVSKASKGWSSDKCLSPLVKQRTELKSLMLIPWPQIFHDSIKPKWLPFFLPCVYTVVQLHVRESEAQRMGIGRLGCAWCSLSDCCVPPGKALSASVPPAVQRRPLVERAPISAFLRVPSVGFGVVSPPTHQSHFPVNLSVKIPCFTIKRNLIVLHLLLRFVLNELVQTEKDYVKDLGVVVEVSGWLGVGLLTQPGAYWGLAGPRCFLSGYLQK